jgi:hypothetical protein
MDSTVLKNYNSTVKLMGNIFQNYSLTNEAPLRVHASPFINTLDPCIRAGQIWWFTSGAVYSES